MPVYGVWTTNRSTPIVISGDNASDAISNAKKKWKKGYGKVKGAKQLKGKDLTDAKKGDWVRTRYDQSNPERGGEKGKMKARKQITKYRKGLARISRESLKKKDSNYSNYCNNFLSDF